MVEESTLAEATSTVESGDVALEHGQIRAEKRQFSANAASLLAAREFGRRLLLAYFKVMLAFSKGFWYGFLLSLSLWPSQTLVQGTFAGFPANYASVNLYLMDIAAVATLLFWVLSLPGRKLCGWPRFHIGPRHIFALLALLIIFSFLSSRSAINSSTALYWTYRMLFFLAIYLYVVNEVRNFKGVAIALVAGLSFQAVLTYNQSASQSSFLRGWGLTAWLPSQSGASVVETESGVRWLRAYGTYFNPNPLGGFAAVSLLALTGLYLQVRARWLAILLPFFWLGLLPLILAFSRSAWVGFGLGIFLITALAARNYDNKWLYSLRIFQLLFAALFLGVVFIASFRDLFVTRLVDTGARLEAISLSERVTYQDIALRLITAHPWSGVGSGNFPVASFVLTGAYDMLQPVHNIFLLIAAETGLLSLVVFAALVLVILFHLWQNQRLYDAWLAVWTGVLVAMLGIGLFDHYWWSIEPGRMTLWLFVSIWVSSLQSIPKSSLVRPVDKSVGGPQANELAPGPATAEMEQSSPG
ncbi:MAG: O-antigen ligase family protein [Chloroflexi bacterium]|nr:O-antigen ligase family protein [Chloroflexota bacterium]